MSAVPTRSDRTANADAWLAGLLPDGADGVALVAVGGYGRGELAPHSDLDVVLLHDGRRDAAELTEIADAVWYPVWDAGVRLDHAVRTVPEAIEVAGEDLKAAVGLLSLRHVAGDSALSLALRGRTLADWRAAARRRLPELRALGEERAKRHGEVAFALEPDLKEGRGGLRDVDVLRAIAAAWVADGVTPAVRAAHAVLLDVRDALHEASGRANDRLRLQEQDAVAAALGLADADVLLRQVSAAGRAIAFALDGTWRRVGGTPARASAAPSRPRVGPAPRRPLADGVVEQDGEVVLARGANPATDPALLLRLAAAAAQAGLPIAPPTLERFVQSVGDLHVPWPAPARAALVALLGAGRSAVGVIEALDQTGLLERLIPEWSAVRDLPQRNALHRFTVDRHLVETAVCAAALTREVGRPDLLLLGALLHDIGKGTPGDHCVTGAALAASVCERIGLPPSDVAVVSQMARWHLLLPDTATRRDIDDPATISGVAECVGNEELLGLLHALAEADGQATGPAAWTDWKASLVGELVRRTGAVLAGTPVARPGVELTEPQLQLVARGGPLMGVAGSQVTVVAPDARGLLWRSAAVLALHRLVVLSARATSHGGTAVTVFDVEPRYDATIDETRLTQDLIRSLDGRLDVGAALARREAYYAPLRSAPVPPPQVLVAHDASETATVFEVRAHDRAGLLVRLARVLAEAECDVRLARVDTLGAEVVDSFYVTGADGDALGVEHAAEVSEGLRAAAE